MPININGNNINKFGKKFPTPYMEKIYVKDTEFVVELSFYFEGILGEPEPAFDMWTGWNSTFAEYIGSLSDLKYNIVAVMDGVVADDPNDPTTTVVDDKLLDPTDRYLKYGPIEIGPTGTKLFENLKSKKISIFDIAIHEDYDYEGSFEDYYLYADNHYLWYGVDSSEGTLTGAGTPRPNCGNVFAQDDLTLLFPIGFDTWQVEKLYKEDGTPVYKFSKEITIGDDGTDPMGAGVNSGMAKFIESMGSGEVDVHFVAYTTPHDTKAIASNSSPHINDRTEIRKKTAYGNFLDIQVSDLCWETVAIQGQVQASPTTIFKGPAGETHTEPPLQSIDGMYYAPVGLDNDAVISRFSDLIVKARDDELRNKLDNLAFILSQYGQEVDILPRINAFRKTFMQTSTATPVGRFHEKLEIRLYNTNNAVKRGVKLKKYLNLNPTVVDVRQDNYGSSTWSAPFGNDSESGIDKYDRRRANEFIYTDAAKLGAYGLPSGVRWDDEAIQEAYNMIAAEHKAREETLAVAWDLAAFLYYEFLDTIQAQTLKLWDQSAIEKYVEEYENIHKVFAFKTPGGNWHKHHDYEWSDKKQVIKFDKPSGWDKFVLVIIGVILLVAAIAIGVGVFAATGGAGFGVFGASAGGWGVGATWGMANTFIYGTLAGLASGAGLGAHYANGVLADFRMGADGFERKDNSKNAKIWRISHEIPEHTGDVLSPSAYYSGGTFSIKCAAFDEGEVSATIPVWPVRSASDLKPPGFETFDETGNLPITFTDSPTNDDMNGTARKRIRHALLTVGTEQGRTKHVSNKDFDPTRSIDDAYTGYLYAYLGAAVLELEVQILADRVYEAQELAQLNASVFYDEYNLYLGGFVFFDYEKALITESYLSDMMDVRKIESWFGRELTQTFFTVKEASVSKYYDQEAEDELGLDLTSEEVRDARMGILPDTGIWMGTMTTEFDYTRGAVKPIKSSVQTHVSLGMHDAHDSDARGSHMKASTKQEAFDGVSSKTVVTSFIPRSFAWASPAADTANNYRMFPFELIDSSGPWTAATPDDVSGCIDENDFEYGDDYLYTAWQPYNLYTIQVKISDHTRNISTILIRSYEHMMNVEFEEYFEAAVEECSYNNIDGYFNKFFVDGIMDAHASNPSQAPWFRAAIIFHAHLDLITDHYGGSQDLVKAAALRDVENIHPAVATLEQLRRFRDKIRNFYDEYYGATGKIKEIHDEQASLFTDGTLTIGAHTIFDYHDYIPTTAATLRNIPNAVNVDYLGYSSMSGDVVTVDLDESFDD